MKEIESKKLFETTKEYEEWIQQVLHEEENPPNKQHTGLPTADRIMLMLDDDESYCAAVDPKRKGELNLLQSGGLEPHHFDDFPPNPETVGAFHERYAKAPFWKSNPTLLDDDRNVRAEYYEDLQKVAKRWVIIKTNVKGLAQRFKDAGFWVWFPNDTDALKDPLATFEIKFPMSGSPTQVDVDAGIFCSDFAIWNKDLLAQFVPLSRVGGMRESEIHIKMHTDESKHSDARSVLFWANFLGPVSKASVTVTSGDEKHLQNILDSLPPEFRSVQLCIGIDQLAYAAATILGLPEKTIDYTAGIGFLQAMNALFGKVVSEEWVEERNKVATREPTIKKALARLATRVADILQASKSESNPNNGVIADKWRSFAREQWNKEIVVVWEEVRPGDEKKEEEEAH